nr:restriction endonuclease subunit S [uncultured Lachnoanaerobaculum sp.]
MSRVPRIRFKGFEEDWEQRKLGEVFIYLRNNTLSREELNDEDGFAQSIHYGDVLIKYGECLNVSKVLLPYVDNKNIVNKFKKFYIQNGDIIIADTAEDETVGKCIEISGLVDHNIISGLHTIPLRPVNKFAYGYLGFYLNSNSYHNQLKPLMQGIKVTSISKNLLKTTTLNYPSNIQEQKIIGRYFDALDHLITLHQRKLEKLKTIKKSMLENLFPQNGEKTPKIRFSGFTEDWEQRKLSEIYKNICNAYVGTATPYYVEDGHFYLEANNVKDGKINYNSQIFINDNFYESQKDKWLNSGDIVMVQSGHVGHTAVIPEELENTVAHALILFKNAKVKIEPYFLNYQYQTLNFKRKIENITVGNTIKHILASDMKEYMVYVSRFAEQIIVSKYFQTLDHLITLHQSKLEKLQKIKKSMLESMFV